MKSHFVIDVDDDGFVRVLKAERSFGAGAVIYSRASKADSLVCTYDLNPKFYGQLDALLITPKKIAAAAPIEPEKVEAQP
jgi:hypothetical protein